MKKILLSIYIGLNVFSISACNYSQKENENSTINIPVHRNSIIKEFYTDDSRDKIEIIIDTLEETVSIHLDGKTYKLKKNTNLPEYTASNDEYLYSNIKGNITFLRKNFDMILFHTNINANHH